jgi:hypothetical protein
MTGLRREPLEAHIVVDGTRVEVGFKIEYFGLVLDGLWEFRPHFEALVRRVGRIANKISRLLPNVGGPGIKARSLYTNTVLSVALYGAPVWADKMCEDQSIKTIMHRSMQIMYIHIVRSYRTVSFLGAGELAGVPPLESSLSNMFGCSGKRGDSSVRVIYRTQERSSASGRRSRRTR